MLSQIFKGHDAGYGVYETDPFKPGEKANGRAKTVRGPLTEELWNKHLSGESRVGVVPICRDDTCIFGAIDIDLYKGLDKVELYKKARENNLCYTESKSGGAHLWAFTEEPVPAGIMRNYLKKVAQKIGYHQAEIFPKQDTLLDPDNDIGNWINIPFYGDSCLGFDGKRLLTKEEWIVTQFKRISYEQLIESPEVPKKKDQEPRKEVKGGRFKDGPPCLEYLVGDGFGEGMRDECMYQAAVYFRQKDRGTMQAELARLNAEACDPPLSGASIGKFTKSVLGKDVMYRCNNFPFVDVCDKQTCIGRKFGVGTSITDLPVISSLEKVDSRPPLWYVTIDGGQRFSCSTEELLDQNKFTQACVNNLNQIPPKLKQATWENLLNHHLSNAVIIEAPEDANEIALLPELVNTYLSSRAQAPDIGSIQQGRPFNDGEHFWFTTKGLADFCKRNNRETKRSEITGCIRTEFIGKWDSKNKGWCVPVSAITKPSELKEVESDAPKHSY